MIGDQYPDETAEELTRREWLLLFGEMIALAGVSGLVPQAATALVNSAQYAATELPPGVYEPSSKHLVHALSSAEGLQAVPAGSATEYVQPRSGVFEPEFFSQEEFRIVTRFIEIVLGKIDPGALAQAVQWVDLWLHSTKGFREAARQLDPMHRALAVAFYGESSVSELENADPQAVVRTGMTVLEHTSRDRFGHGFLDLNESQQMQLVSPIGTAPENTPLRKFFDITRREAIRGFYTSREGLKELDYQGNAFYPDCPGCDSSAITKPPS